MATGIICQACGIEAPTRRVDFHQNIGMLVMRTRRRMNGMLCKQCVHKYFWKMTGTTLVLGPWGTISLILAPCFIINNVVRYLSVIGMPPVPMNATQPILTDKAIKQLQPFTKAMFDRLNTNEPLESVATDIAARARVTPGQVVKYVVAVSQQNRPQRGTGGFPVVQKEREAVLPVIPLEGEAEAESMDEEPTTETTD